MSIFGGHKNLKRFDQEDRPDEPIDIGAVWDAYEEQDKVFVLEDMPELTKLKGSAWDL